MALYHDEGIVLRTTKLGEADRIITLCTKDHGKMRAVAKGVRRTKSRFGARLEPFMRVDMLLSEGRTFDTISQAETIAPYANAIITQYESYQAANIITETLNDILTTEHEPAPAQYQLLIGALYALATHKHMPDAIAYSYVLRALSLAGWTARLNSCVVCGRHNQLEYFSPAAGGVLCRLDHTPDAIRLDDGILTQLQALQAGDWAILDALTSLHADTARAVQMWAQYYVERPVRSMHLLD